MDSTAATTDFFLTTGGVDQPANHLLAVAGGVLPQQ
jgi:hypothetical protein